MLRRPWLRYLLCIFAFSLFVFLFQHYVALWVNSKKTPFDINPFQQIILSLVFFVVCGMLIGLDTLLNEIRKKGVWKINIPKLVVLGIPSLFFTLYIYFYYFGLPIFKNFIDLFEVVAKNGSSHIKLFQVLLGFSIITSVYKEEKI